MRYKLPLLGIATASLILVAGGAAASPGATTLVSVDSAGNQADRPSGQPSISADGRYVAFVSWATNLAPEDANRIPGGSVKFDIYLHDRQTRQTTRVSVDSGGNAGNNSSGGPGTTAPANSADGRYVAFSAVASNLVSEDTNDTLDVFVHDIRTGETTRVSVDSSGNEGNGQSWNPAIGANGRYVAFSSHASNLVASDDNICGTPPKTYNCLDAFVHDRQTGETTRVSVGSAGAQGNGQSWNPAISADGRYVAFLSEASTLVPGDSNNSPDVFVHDRQTGETSRVSVDSAGNQGKVDRSRPAISADGRYVAFSSDYGMVPEDTNGVTDVFIHDRETGKTARVSVDSAGNQGNASSRRPGMSADGRFVAFESSASNLVSDDTNSIPDVFVRDLQTGETTRVSIDSAGNQANAWVDGTSNEGPGISGDGRYVAFGSIASNLVPGDTTLGGDVFVHDRLGQPEVLPPPTPAALELPPVGCGEQEDSPLRMDSMALAGLAVGGAFLLAAGAWYAKRRRRVG